MKTEDELFAEGFELAEDGTSEEELNKLGEKAVRYALARGKFGTPGSRGHSFVLAWLDLRLSLREERTFKIAVAAMVIAAISSANEMSAIANFVLSMFHP